MASALAVCCILLLARLATAQDVLNVSSSDALQAAILAKAPFIRITQHLDLTTLNPGTTNAGTLVFPGSLTSMVIWGECADVAIPTMDYYDRVAKLKKTGACGLYSAARDDGRDRLRSTIKHTSGRLLLANLLVHTAADPAMKMNVAVSVYNAQLWLETVVFAGFSTSAVYSLDSDVYMIGSWTYQKGPGPSPESGVNFLVLTDTEDAFKLFLGNTVFHADWMNEYAPVYVGRADDPRQNTTVDGIHGSWQPIRGRPLVVSHETIQHVHSQTGGGFRGECVGICVWAEGGSSVDLYTNSTPPTERGDPQYIPLPASFPPNVTMAAADAALVQWADVVQDVAAHQEWVTQLRAAGVFGVDMLWDPVTHDTGLPPPSPPSANATTPDSGGGGSSHTGLIIGLAAAGAVVLLLCLVFAFILLRRKRRQNATEEALKAPPSPPPSISVKPDLPIVDAAPYGHSDADGFPPGLPPLVAAPSTPTDSVRSRQSERSRFTEPPPRGPYDVPAKSLPPPSPGERSSFMRLTSAPPLRGPPNDSAHESVAEQMSESSLTSSHAANHGPHAPPPLPPPLSSHAHKPPHLSSFGSSPSSYHDQYYRHGSLPHPSQYYSTDPYYTPEPYGRDYPPPYGPPYPPPYYPPPHPMYRHDPYRSFRRDAELRELDELAAQEDAQRARDPTSLDANSESGTSAHGSRSPRDYKPRLSPSLALQLHPIPAYHFTPPNPYARPPPERAPRSSDTNRDSLGPLPLPPKDTHSSLASLERTTFNHTETRTTASAGSDYTQDRILLSENVISKSELSKFELLEHQLDALEKKGGVLLNRYKMQGPSRRRYGGQGVVQFAKMVYNTKKKVAIKFFLSRSAFENEQALYLDTRLHKILPPVDEIYNNNDGSLRDPLGRVIPQFLVMEKGESLSEWSQRQVPDFASCMQIIMHLAERVGELHSHNLVHCDLKPTNTIWLSSRNEWTIIDFGSSGQAGQPISLSVSLGYSAPELITAHLQGDKKCIANPAVDVWSIGVMAYELLTNTPAFPKGPGLFNAVAASVKGGVLPWEDTNAPTYHAHKRKLGFMHDALMMMLQRDPEQRPTLRDVSQMWRRALQQETAATAAALSHAGISRQSSPTVEVQAPP